MKKSKRFLSLLLAVAMVMGLMLSGVSATTGASDSNVIMSESFESWASAATEITSDYSVAGGATSWNGATAAEGWAISAQNGSVLVQPALNGAQDGNVSMKLTLGTDTTTMNRAKLQYRMPQSVYDKMEHGAEYTFTVYFKGTAKGVVPVLITMGSLLVLSYIMQAESTGMMSLIANDIAGLAGMLYPAAAVFIGSLGSFMTGTGLGSNIMFAGMHTEAAAALGMNPITVFAGQNAGASLGNLICPNNTVAACATVGEVGNESKVMFRTLPAFAIILVEYMILATVYTVVLFPNFGM